MAERNYGRARNSQFQLRFSDELHQRLKEEAAKNERPVNAEIIYRLNRSFEADKSLHQGVADLLDHFIEQEVNTRLRAIASQLGASK